MFEASTSASSRSFSSGPASQLPVRDDHLKKVAALTEEESDYCKENESFLVTLLLIALTYANVHDTPDTDVSNAQIGCVLMQDQPSDKQMRPM